MYLITAYFDDTTNKILQKYIDKIAEDTGNNFMIENHVPPHLTISAIEAKQAEVLLPFFQKLQGTIEVGSVNFASVGQLLPYVFYAMPVLNNYLMKLSGQVYDAVQNIPETNVSRFYKPGSWLPHVTLGKTLDSNQMKKAFEVMQNSFQVFEGKVVGLGLARVNPHEDIGYIDL